MDVATAIFGVQSSRMRLMISRNRDGKKRGRSEGIEVLYEREALFETHTRTTTLLERGDGKRTTVRVPRHISHNPMSDDRGFRLPDSPFWGPHLLGMIACDFSICKLRNRANGRPPRTRPRPLLIVGRLWCPHRPNQPLLSQPRSSLCHVHKWLWGWGRRESWKGDDSRLKGPTLVPCLVGPREREREKEDDDRYRYGDWCGETCDPGPPLLPRRSVPPLAATPLTSRIRRGAAQEEEEVGESCTSPTVPVRPSRPPSAQRTHPPALPRSAPSQRERETHR